jgi:predicted RNA-binding Zn-ribbon protein involved in translation (DUF1610 family)
MTVEIVGKKLDPEVIKKTSCRSCGVILKYTPNDVKARHGTDIGGGPDGEEWIDCPSCGKKVIIRSC